MQLSIASTSAAVGSDGCAPGREAAIAPAAQARRSASSRSLPSSIETTRHAVNASPAAVPSTACTRRCVGPSDLLAALEQDRALFAERQREQPRRLGQRLELVAVDDHELGGSHELRRERPRRRGVEEEALRAARGRRDRLERDLELAEHRPPPTCGSRSSALAPGATTIWFSPSRVHEDQRDARSSPSARSDRARTPRLAQARPEPRRRTRRRRRCRRTRTSAPSRAAATAWFAPLPPGKARRTRAGDRLPRPRQPLAARDEVEVDREPTTGSRIASGGEARARSSSARPSRFSRRSKRPAQSDERSGAERMRAASPRPCERPHEDRELEVRLRDAHRRGAHAGAVQHRLPLEQLGRAGLAVPRPALRAFRLELEQVAAERPSSPASAVSARSAARRSAACAAARRRRRRVAAGPALEQPAERERGDLARAQLRGSGARRVSIVGGVVQRARLPSPGSARERAHTSTTTGRIIGRRPVRS